MEAARAFSSHAATLRRMRSESLLLRVLSTLRALCLTMARLKGALSVRTRHSSSRKIMSSTQWNERVRPSPAARLRLGPGQAGIGLDPIRAGSRKPRLGRGGLRGKRSSITHVKPHLVVGDVGARQAVDSPRIETNQ